MTLSLVASLGALAASFAPLQTSSLQYPIDVVAGPNSTPVTAACAGKLNDDSMIDIASLRGGQILIAYDPALGESSGTVPGEYNDFDAAADDTEDTDARTMYAVSALGLQRLEWTPASQTFVPVDAFDPFTQMEGYQAWLGAKIVRVGDVDGQEGPDLVGIAANGRTVLVALADGPGFRMLPSYTFQPEIADVAVDLCVVDRNNDGVGEIGIATATSFEVYDIVGTRLALDVHGAEVIGIEPYRRRGSQTTGFAVLQAPVLGNASITLYSPDTLQPFEIVGLHGMTPTGMRAVTFDDLGGTELVVARSTQKPAELYVQRNGSLTQAGLNSAWPLRNGDAPLYGAAPVVIDVDNDSDPDVLYLIADVDQLNVAHNATVDHTTLAPKLYRQANGDPHLWMPLSASNAPADTAFARYLFHAGGAFDPEVRVPSQATHLQLYLWTATEVAFGKFATGATPTEAVAYSLGADAQYGSWWDPFGGTVRYFEHQFDVFSAVSTDARLHFLTARYVRLGSDGNVKESWPHMTVHFARVGDSSAAAYINGLPFATNGVRLYDFDPHIQPTGGTEVGGGGGTGCVPDYPPGTPPQEVPPTPIP